MMGGDEQDGRPMDDDMSDEADRSSDEGRPTPAVRPAPVATVPSSRAHEPIIDLSGQDLEPVGGDMLDESLGDLPGPSTERGSSTRVAFPATSVGPESLRAGPNPRPAPRPSARGGTISRQPVFPPPDPSDGTGVFTKEEMARRAEEEADDAPSDAPPPPLSLKPPQPTAAPPPPVNTPGPTDVDDRAWFGDTKPPMVAEVQYEPDDEDDIPVARASSNHRPLIGAVAVMAVVLVCVLGFVAFTGGGIGLYALTTGGDNATIGSEPVAVVPATVPDPGESSVSHEYYVAVSGDTVLATVEVEGVAQKCTIIEYEKRALESVQLDWPNLSHYERWEVCAPDLRKGPAGDNGGHVLVAGDGDGVTINLKEVIVVSGGSYTTLPSTSGAIARCWGLGQTNGDGQPTCSPKPPQFAEFIEDVEPTITVDEGGNFEPVRTEADTDNK